VLGRQQAYFQKYGGLAPWLPPVPRPPDLHFFGEAGFWMVHSYFSSNHAFLSGQRQGTGTTPPPTTQSANFPYPVDFGPRLTVGVLGLDGWGLRASWWLLDEGSRVPIFRGATSLNAAVRSPPIAGVPGILSPSTAAQQLKVFGDSLAFNNHLRLQVYDWEGFRQLRGDWGTLLLGGGVRYAALSQSYQGFRANSGTAKAGTTTSKILEDSDVLDSGRNFSGVGPTGAIEVRRPLGASGLGLYGAARGSVLFGSGHAQAFERTALSVQTTVGSAAPKTSSTSALLHADGAENRTVPMLDVEVGVDGAFSYGLTRIFGQIGLVNQTWFNTGSATGSGGDLGFFGMRVTVGLTY
jgi:hypothetical protein